jgi:gliding motility-associated-like protein
MKKISFLFTIVTLFIMFANRTFAQGGSTCAAAAPFCTGTTYQYDNNINTSSQAGPNYGCLATQPNPSWYWMQIGTAGNIDISISQTTGINNTGTGIDVDFILWGPFTSATGGCGNLVAGNTIDCSYSAAPTETANITGAVVGQFYLLLLTNYSNQTGYITFSQSGGSGATNCAVVSGCTATINNGGPFCAGSPITMSCTPQPNATNYTWTGPNAFSQSGASLTSVSIPASTPAMAGTYTLTITRSPGTPCVLTTAVVVNSTTATFSTPTPTQCLTGNSFNFTHTGTAGATHNWNFGGATVNTSTAANPAGVTYAAAGTYIVTHTATANGCPRTQTMSVTVRPMPALTGVPSNASCGANNGSIVINNTSAGGQGPFSFTNNGTAVGSQTITGLAPGTYTIGITNTFGCTVTTPVVVGTNAGPSNITLTPTNASCGLSNGSFAFGSPVGGTGPYTYAFNGGAFTAVSPMTGLAAGTYSITVRDVNGCVFTKTVVVANSAGPTAITGTTTSTGCGLTNGTYNITGVTGGTGAYTFSVDGVSTASLTSGLASGTHTITVADAVGCTFNTTFNIGGTTGPNAGTVATTNASCGGANGTATVSGAAGGTSPYQYSFDGSPFAVGTTTTGLSAGSHTVIIRDAGGCTFPVIYNILNTGSPTATVTNTVNVSCFGGSNGSFTVTPVGGTGPLYTYTLTGPSPTQTNGTGFFSGLPQGTYNITVKDQVGCVTTTSVTITQPAVLTLTATPVAALCNGTATGTVNLVGAGGTPTYSYNLNGGAYQASATFANQFAAIYSMGIRDANGCTATQTVQVTQPAALTLNVSTQNANCTAANGVASTTVTGGTGVITYTWTGGGGAAAVSNSVVAGNYIVTATDANGCAITATAVIGLTPGGTAAITASSNITCNGANNGNLTAGMIGGTPIFTYSWSPSGQTTAMATGLSAGTHTCVITDNFGCTATTVGTLTQPTLLTAIMNSNNVKCFGTATGTVSAAGSGGTFPYTYLWTSLASTLATVPNVAIGTHTCNITDANGCTITQTIGVTQPSSITITSTVTSASCNQANGSTTITAAGGIPAYTYSWSTGSTLPSISNQFAGTYTVEVKDANNCIQILAATISNNSGPSISVSTQTNVSCFGGNNGVAVASVAGGAPTYTYNWSGGQVTPTATNLLAGVHTVTVTDANGCVASTSVNITQPTALTVNLTPTNPKCFGAANGFGSAIALGGTPGAGYTYTWTGGGGNATLSNFLGAGVYGLTVADANGCTAITSMTLTNPPAMVANVTFTNVTCFNTCNGLAAATVTNNFGVVGYEWTGGPSVITGQTAMGLCAGTYTLLATDQNSCTAGGQVIITEPTQVTANITSTGSVTCNGGNNGFAAVTAAGGTGAHTYNWSPSGITAATANTLTAGVYVVTVADQNLCTATATATILQPTPLATTLTTTNILCNGGSDGTANVAYLGGAGATTFLWGPGLQSGNPVNNLLAGPQTVTITSNGACPTVLTFTLTEPAALTAAVSATNSNCGLANGKVCAVVAGGTGSLSPLWSNGITTLCNNNVLAGAYTFSVTDANGCVAQASGLINDIAGPVVSITSSTNVSCFGGSNGAATTTITGGAGAISVSWSPAGQTTQNVSNFNSGIKNITVTDAAGCVGTASVQITEPTQLVSAIGSFTNVSCFGQSNGGATILVNGGTPGYSYVWSPSAQTNSVLTNVPASAPTVTVTDANGCTTTSSLVISQPSALVMAASSFSNISCFGGSNGQISTTVQGGTGAYNYVWLPAGSAPSLSGLVAGGYSVTVTDQNACSINATFNIIEPSALTSTFVSSPATCGLANGAATVTVNGGTPTYNLSWNTFPVTLGNIASNLTPGNSWSCLITDSKGCSITQTVSIANPPTSTITGFSVTPPTCFGLSNGEITINYTAGSGPYTVSWSNPISQTITTAGLTQSIVGVGAGAYSATVTDSYNCSTSQPVIVSQPSLLVLTPMVNPKICYGESAQIYATGQNGTPAYTYTWSPNPFVGGGPHTVSPTVTTSYTVAVSDINGCSPSPKVITVQVTPQLIIDGYSTSACHGASVTLTPVMSGVGNSGPYDFIWSNGVSDLNTQTSSINVVANHNTNPNTYSVTVKDNCTLPDGQATFTINVNPLPIIDFTITPSGCAPLNSTLTANSNNPATDIYTWGGAASGSGNPQIITFLDSGKYTVTLLVTNQFGCKQDTTKIDVIEVYPQPVASFYADPQTTSILDPNIDFINTSQGATSYYWDFGDPLATGGTNTSIVTSPSHYYSVVGPYAVNLVATTVKGCKDTAKVIVEITPDFAVYIPNTFTPDGNGLNDIFQPMGVGIDEENYRLDIYDRWGENIFTSNAFRKGWDGTVKGGSKIAEQGVYIYKMTVRDTKGNKHPYVGHVTLLKKDN